MFFRCKLALLRRRSDFCHHGFSQFLHGIRIADECLLALPFEIVIDAVDDFRGCVQEL